MFVKKKKQSTYGSLDSYKIISKFNIKSFLWLDFNDDMLIIIIYLFIFNVTYIYT